MNVNKSEDTGIIRVITSLTIGRAYRRKQKKIPIDTMKSYFKQNTKGTLNDTLCTVFQSEIKTLVVTTREEKK